MSVITFQIKFGRDVKTLRIKGQQITIGRSRDCGLVIPFPWLQEQHLIVRHDGDVVRLKAANPLAAAKLNGKPVTQTWELVPAGAALELEGPDKERLSIEFKRGGPAYNALAAPVQQAVQGELFGVEFVTPSFADQEGWSGSDEALASDTSSASATEQEPRKPSRWRRVPPGLLLIVMLALVSTLAVAALAWNGYRRGVETRQFEADSQFVQERFTQAQDLLKKKDYAAAKAALDAAEPVIARNDRMKEEAQQLAYMRSRPQIEFGGQGYIEMESRWLPPDLARAWQEARRRDDPKIQTLFATAEAALRAQRYDEGRLACDEALAIMDAHPVKPHPRAEAINRLAEQLKKQATTAEMVAKGMVQHGDRWVTQEEKFKLEQEAKGLAEYKGQWLPKDEAFANAQKDKGLVLVNGRWITQAEQMTAQGLVFFEGAWVKPEERDRVLASRSAQALPGGGTAAAGQPLEAGQSKTLAYAMSQGFVRREIRSFSTISFENVSSDEVVVVSSDGWYLVTAPVVITRGTRQSRASYICKLRPTRDGGRWEAESTVILGN